jgi:hypothetical protein
LDRKIFGKFKDWEYKQHFQNQRREAQEGSKKNYRNLYGSLVQGNWPKKTKKNASGQNATDGTPYDKNIIDAPGGFYQAVMSEAGLTPNGESETAGASQILQALKIVVGNENHPIGSGYVQRFNDPDPLDNGLPGQWLA